ncbi:hypothetical protein J6G99_03645 [bacterium]|nr:hypothetical protein [bacterium]
MFDIERNLRELEYGAENIISKEFATFADLETSYLKLINKGNDIRNYLKQNPSLCNDNTLKILNNQSADFSLLEEKYKPLARLIPLIQNLLGHYQKYLNELLSRQDYAYAINIYEQMFKFTHNYNYKLEIANIYYLKLNNQRKSYEIYKEIEPYMENNLRFLYGFSELYKYFGNYFKQMLYIKKAIEAEAEELKRNAQ